MPPDWWWDAIVRVARYCRQPVPVLQAMSVEDFGRLYDAMARLLDDEAPSESLTE